MPEETNGTRHKTRASKNYLEIAESVSKIASYVAIPVIIAFGTWWIQGTLSTQAVSKDYVNMALSLLQKKPETDQERELRDWAVDLLNDNAPTKLPAKTKADLKSGRLNFGFVETVLTYGFALSPDSKNIAVGGNGETIHIYDLATGKLVSTTVPQAAQASTVPSSKSPGISAVDQLDQAIAGGQSFWRGFSVVSALAYSPDGQKLLFGTSEGVVKLWNLKTGEILNFEHEKSAVTAVAFASGGNNVIVRDLMKDRIETFDGAGKRVGELKLRSGDGN
jgi:WD40 repeat protein